MRNFDTLYGFSRFDNLVDGTNLIRFSNLTEEKAKQAPSMPILGFTEFYRENGKTVSIGHIPADPIVAATGKGRKILEQAAPNEDYFALVSGACAFIIKNNHENPKLVLTWRDPGAPTFKNHVHICGGISGYNKRGLDFETLHPGYVALQEGKQEILWGSNIGIFDPVMLNGDQDFKEADSSEITQHSLELVQQAGLYNRSEKPLVPENIIKLKAEYIRQEQEGVFVVDWENKLDTFTKAHILVSSRSKNIDVTKIVVLDFENIKFDDLYPIYTEEFQSKPLATPLYIVELNSDYTLASTGKMAGMYRNGILERFDIPLFNFQMTDPLYCTLDILGPRDLVRKSIDSNLAKKLWPYTE